MITVRPWANAIDHSWSWFHQHCVGAYFPSAPMVADGAIVTDHSRQRRSGTIDNSSGDITLSGARTGPGWKFSGDATNDRIDLGSIPSTHPLNFGNINQMSWVIGLVYDGTGGAFPRPFDKSDSGNAANGYSLWYETTRFNFRLANGREHYYTVGLTAGDEFQLGFSIDTTGNFQYYRDGLPVLGTSSGAYGGFTTATTNMAIGNWNHSTDRMWGGDVQFVYFFEGAAPPSLFNRIAQSPFAPFDGSEETPLFVTPPVEAVPVGTLQMMGIGR